AAASLMALRNEPRRRLFARRVLAFVDLRTVLRFLLARFGVLRALFLRALAIIPSLAASCGQFIASAAQSQPRRHAFGVAIGASTKILYCCTRGFVLSSSLTN